jgi:ElaB/YqjD/DUF883 family membrane-anchored ribosome-binding protein
MNNNYGNDLGSGSTSSSTSGTSSAGSSTKAESRSRLNETRSATSTEPHGVDLRKYLDEAKSLGEQLETQMSSRPYVALGAVAGISFLAGSLLGSRIGQLAVAIGIGYAATHFLQGTDMKAIAKKATQNL